MAEQEKNYLDIEATAAQVKKGIEEIVEALTPNVDNNNTVFALEVAENLSEGYEEEDPLNRVKIRLKKVSAISPVEVNEGEMPIGDGKNWLKKSHLYSSFFPTGDPSGVYTEVRFGPDMITEPKIPYPDGTIGYNTSRFVISGNPLAIEDETSSSTNSDTRVKANDAKTFKLVVAETANAIFEDSSKLSVKGAANAIFEDSSKLSVKGAANVSFGDYSRFVTDGDGLHFSSDNNWNKTRFTFSDALMDITGNTSYGNTMNPEIFIHNKVKINIDGGNYSAPNVAELIMHGNCTLNMDDGLRGHVHGMTTYENRVQVHYYIAKSDLPNENIDTLSAYDIVNNKKTKITIQRYNSNDPVGDTLQEIRDNGWSFYEYTEIDEDEYKEGYYHVGAWYRITATQGLYNYWGGTGRYSTVNHASIKVHDKAYLSLNKGVHIFGTDKACACFEGNSFFKMDDNASARFMNNSLLLMQAYDYPYSPCICMNGGGQILFNSTDQNPRLLEYDPYFIANPTSFIYIGQGSTGSGTDGPTTQQGNVNSHIYISETIEFEDPDAIYGTSNIKGLTETSKKILIEKINELEKYGTIYDVVEGNISSTKLSNGGYSYRVVGCYAPKNTISQFGSLGDLCCYNRNPRIQVADETMIVIDAAHGKGANYIKIGAGEGQLLQFHLTGNIFQQMSGNAHSEIHDNSKLIMRGPLPIDKKPWHDGTKDNGHYGRDWRRPILSDNSPILGLYDVAQFTMRGVWNTDDNWVVNKTGKILSNWDTTLSIPTSIEELPEEFKEKLITGTITKIRDYKDEDGNILTTFTLTETNLKVANYEYSTKPLDWNEYLDKIEDQPVVEIIENADVRIYGNSELKLTDYSVIANSEGFTFKDNTIGEEVSFSMSELKELKKLLTGATITE